MPDVLYSVMFVVAVVVFDDVLCFVAVLVVVVVVVVVVDVLCFVAVFVVVVER